MLSPFVLLALPRGHASAYYFLDAGTRGLSRGGAFVAGADDLSAQYYNPAALSRLRRPQAMFDFSLVDQQVSFTRIDRDPSTGEEITTWPTVENEGPPMRIPSFGVATKLGLRDWTFAFGMYPPYAPDMEYPADGAQRYILTDSLVWQIYAGPTVAWKPLPWLSVGLGVVWSLVRAENELTLVLCPDQESLGDTADGRCSEDYYASGGTENDVSISMKMLDPWNLTAHFGLLVEPWDWLSVGASLMPPVPVEGRGTLSGTFSDDHWLLAGDYPFDGTPPLLAGDHYQDDDITVRLTMPMVARLGVAVRPLERLEVELAGVYQGWHVLDEVQVTEVQLVLEHNPDSGLLDDDIVVTDDVVLPANYRDTWSVRLGGSWSADRWVARAGTFWESSAVPPETQGVALVDGNKMGAALGGTVRVGRRLALDFGALHTWIADRTITDSELTALEVPVDTVAAVTSDEPPRMDIVDGAVVGNGRFSSNLTMLSAGVVVYLD